MANNNLQESLQSSPPLFYHGIIETVQIHLSRQRRDADTCALALEQIAEDLEVGVPAAHFGAAEFEGRDVGGESDEVGGVS